MRWSLLKEGSGEEQCCSKKDINCSDKTFLVGQVLEKMDEEKKIALL